MKFNIEQSKFLEGVKTVKSVVQDNSTSEILKCILLDAQKDENGQGRLIFRGTDAEMTINHVVDCDVDEPGRVTIRGSYLLAMTQNLPSGVMVEFDCSNGIKGSISAESVYYNISCGDAQAFPDFPNIVDSNVFEVDLKVLKEMFRKTVFAVGVDDSRRVLRGVLMRFENNKLLMVATNGRRLAMIEKCMEWTVEECLDMIVPQRTVMEIMRTQSTEQTVKIELKGSQASFTIGKTSLFTRLIDGVYPNYNAVIPQDNNFKIQVPRERFMKALTRANVMTIEEKNSVKLEFNDNLMAISAVAGDQGSARDEVPIQYIGNQIEMIFNPDYLMDVLKALDDDDIVFEIKDGLTSAIIRCATPDIPFIYVIMPLRPTTM